MRQLSAKIESQMMQSHREDDSWDLGEEAKQELEEQLPSPKRRSSQATELVQVLKIEREEEAPKKSARD